MMGHSPLFVLGVSLLGAPSSGGSLEIDLHIDPCLGALPDEVRRLTALELTVRVVSARAKVGQATRVELGCAADGIRLRVTDRESGKTLERNLTFEALEADVRSRAVALAVAELVLTSWTEQPETTETAERTESAKPDLPPQESPPEVDRAAKTPSERNRGEIDHVLAVGQANAPLNGLGVGWGGGVRVAWASPIREFGADVDLIVSRADAETELGRVSASSWSAALRARLRLSLDPVFIDGGVGGRFGIARLEGNPKDATARGSVVAGTWGGPLAHAEAGFEVNQIALVLGVEAGYRLRGVSGQVDGASPVGLNGTWLSASVGLGWSP